MARQVHAPRIPIIFHSRQGLEKPNDDKIVPLESVADVLEWEEHLRGELFGNEKLSARDSRGKTSTGDRLQEIWFRGTRKHFPLAPGIYRTEITDLANDNNRDWLFGDRPPRSPESALELKRLNIERDMMLAFEREAGPLLEYNFEQELYFLARHYGMPSRLLDWSISPLIALFMCVFPEPRRPPRRKNMQEEPPEEDGVIYAMDPEKLDPPGYICHQHDPMVKEAIEVVTMWNDEGYKEEDNPAILPIRPHTLAGRIDRQLSRFTLHCYKAKPQENDSLRSRRVSKDCKERIRGQLERMGVNEFSVYYTLDRLVTDISDRFSNFR
jgi:FRG domain